MHGINFYVIAFLRPSGIRKFDPHIQEDSRSVKGKNFNSFDSYFSLKTNFSLFPNFETRFLKNKKKMKSAGWSMTLVHDSTDCVWRLDYWTAHDKTNATAHAPSTTK